MAIALTPHPEKIAPSVLDGINMNYLRRHDDIKKLIVTWAPEVKAVVLIGAVVLMCFVTFVEAEEVSGFHLRWYTFLAWIPMLAF